MKTIKIDEQVHKQLLNIKAHDGYKTISETINVCIAEYWYRNLPYENKDVRKLKK